MYEYIFERLQHSLSVLFRLLCTCAYTLILIYSRPNLLAIHDVLRMFTCSSSLDSVQDGFTALMVAAQNGHCEVVRMLLEAKADVNIKTNVSDVSYWCVCALVATS